MLLRGYSLMRDLTSAEGSVKSSIARRLGLLSSTPGITVVIGFPFTASPESPCASETSSLFSAGNGRTSTAPSRPQRGSLAHCQARIYGGQPTSYPGLDLSRGRSHSPHPSVTGSYDERLTCE